MVMTYTDDVQVATIKAKMEAVLDAMRELASDGDEALDAYNRPIAPMHYGTGFEWCAPAPLGFYGSTGTGTLFIDKLIERCEQSQADEWARQYPSRVGLFECYGEGGGEFYQEAEEWIDAATDEQWIYLSLEIELRDGDVIIRAALGDEINRPVGGKWFEERIDQDDFLKLGGKDLESLVTRAINTAYQNEE